MRRKCVALSMEMFFFNSFECNMRFLPNHYHHSTDETSGVEQTDLVRKWFIFSSLASNVEQTDLVLKLAEC